MLVIVSIKSQAKIPRFYIVVYSKYSGITHWSWHFVYVED